MGDAFHLATALHYTVNEFHTLDGSGRHGRRTDLLKLNGNVAGARLIIVQPNTSLRLSPSSARCLRSLEASLACSKRKRRKARAMRHVHLKAERATGRKRK